MAINPQRPKGLRPWPPALARLETALDAIRTEAKGELPTGWVVLLLAVARFQDDEEGITATDLAERFEMSPQTVAEVIRKMCAPTPNNRFVNAEGWLQQELGQGRSKRLFLTPKGISLLRRVAQIMAPETRQ